MFEPYKWNGIDIGFAKTTSDTFIFFGNRNLPLAMIPEAFPKFKFFKIKQIHSATVIEARETLEGADAHYTRKPNEALIVQTADCMPILMSGRDGVAACHAGWRGLVGNIIPKTMKVLGSVEDIYIGPHIGPKSFEVGADVSEEIAGSAGSREPKDRMVMSHRDPNKRYIHLARIALSQIRAAAQPSPRIETLHFDTKTNLGFHSFRRDGAKAERQYSFIVRLR